MLIVFLLELALKALIESSSVIRLFQSSSTVLFLQSSTALSSYLSASSSLVNFVIRRSTHRLCVDIRIPLICCDGADLSTWPLRYNHEIT